MSNLSKLSYLVNLSEVAIRLGQVETRVRVQAFQFLTAFFFRYGGEDPGFDASSQHCEIFKQWTQKSYNNRCILGKG